MATQPLRRSHRADAAEKTSHQDTEDDKTDDPLDDLTRPQVLEINRVFDHFLQSNTAGDPIPFLSLKSPSSSKNGLNPETKDEEEADHEAGGFLAEDDLGGGFLAEDDLGGGFIAPEEEAFETGGFIAENGKKRGGFVTQDESLEETRSTLAFKPCSNFAKSISLAKIPEALKMLGLPYKNSDILAIFENAASSEEESDRNKSVIPRSMNEKRIRRAKFLKVCGVLMANHGSSPSSNSSVDSLPSAKAKNDSIGEDKDGSDYDSASAQESSSSEFCLTRPSRRGSARHKTSRSMRTKTYQSPQRSPAHAASLNSIPKPSRRKRKAENSAGTVDDDDGSVSALKTFGLFFESGSSASDPNLRTLTIGFDEVKRAANDLGEQITSVEIDEMLNYASYSNDSRVTFEAFQKLMKEIKTI
ncbi:hypothetical protein O181_011687 [Austropuccinia psidii MF-1]|uniref:EF-hand domain-containing protein n=1 Tax=Austropuccinia psidii MF-1 TaxID=1389203 RepID=A0A9Q3GMB4_9BASI|nr:hypothetical protein [Austropuccinia psidii MF-1]